jgi:hypothetical protein
MAIGDIGHWPDSFRTNGEIDPFQTAASAHTLLEQVAEISK